jgi:hypothetical protein
MANGLRPIFRRPRRPSIDASAHGALFGALGLASMPGFAQRVGRQPLPEGVLELIKIVAGCEETLCEAAALTGREPEAVKAAADFYLRHALFFDGAEPFRILGVAAGAKRDEMRLHMRWLMIWLHPDHAHDPQHAALAGRVLEAWRQSASGPWLAPPPAGVATSAAASARSATRGGALRLIGIVIVGLLAVAALLVLDLGLDIGLDVAQAPASADEAAGGFQ